MGFNEIVTDQCVLLFVAILTGLFIGKIRIGRFAFGTSGILISGIVIGWLVQKYVVIPGADAAAGYALRFIERGAVSSEIFTLSLIVFIAAVGLLAAKEMGAVFRRFGIPLVVLGILVTLVGAAASWLFGALAGIGDPWTVSGVFTGALTSSPGLASAMEGASPAGPEAQAAVGAGYALGYSPGVIAVILAVQFIPALLGMDIAKERAEIETLLGSSGPSMDPRKPDSSGLGWGLIPFAVVCVAGTALGSLSVPLGSMGRIGLGVTGGVLVSALVLGAVGRIGPLSFRETHEVLAARRDLGLSLFLGVIGLKYGYITIDTLGGEGILVMAVSFAVALVAILVGFVVGRYVFKLNWIILSGGLCGAMTSTPGLGAAIDAAGSDLAAVGYGAAYPFALFGMVIFTVLIQKLPLL